MENKKDFLKDLINMVENEDRENCGEIVEKVLNNYTKEIQDCVNDLGFNKFSAPFIVIALETVLRVVKQSVDIENDALYKTLSKSFDCAVFQVTKNTDTNEITDIKTFKVDNKKSSDGGDEDHTSENN